MHKVDKKIISFLTLTAIICLLSDCKGTNPIQTGPEAAEDDTVYYGLLVIRNHEETPPTNSRLKIWIDTDEHYMELQHGQSWSVSLTEGQHQIHAEKYWWAFGDIGPVPSFYRDAIIYLDRYHDKEWEW